MSTFQPAPKPEPRRKKRPNPGHPYLAWLKAQPCHTCGSAPSEAAHVEGPLSLKTGHVLPRRRDEAYLSAVPLCSICHRGLHEVGETHYALTRHGSSDALARLAHAYLASWILEGRP